MQFLTALECKTWCQERQIKLDDRGYPARGLNDKTSFRCAFPKSFTQFLWFAQFIEKTLQPRDNCLLWITEWGIWRSSENLHLYYKLRQAYGDNRLLEKAPGHIFQKFESSDLTTFLELSMLFGWGGYLLPTEGYSRGFISHDEWAELIFENPEDIESLKSQLVKAGINLVPVKR